MKLRGAGPSSIGPFSGVEPISAVVRIDEAVVEKVRARCM